MDFIGYFVLDPKDFPEVMKKFKKVMDSRDTEPNKFPKIAYGPVSMGGEWKGFTVYENPTPEQINALIIEYAPEMTFKFEMLYPTPKFIEQYLKMKK